MEIIKLITCLHYNVVSACSKIYLKTFLNNQSSNEPPQTLKLHSNLVLQTFSKHDLIYYAIRISRLEKCHYSYTFFQNKNTFLTFIGFRTLLWNKALACV